MIYKFFHKLFLLLRNLVTVLLQFFFLQFVNGLRVRLRLNQFLPLLLFTYPQDVQYPLLVRNFLLQVIKVTLISTYLQNNAAGLLHLIHLPTGLAVLFPEPRNLLLLLRHFVQDGRMLAPNALLVLALITQHLV